MSQILKGESKNRAEEELTYKSSVKAIGKENIDGRDQRNTEGEPSPTTAGTHYTVSTAPEQQMDLAASNSLTTMNTSVSVAGSSSSIMENPRDAILGKENMGISKRFEPHTKLIAKEVSPPTVDKLFEAKYFYDIPVGHAPKETISASINTLTGNTIAAVTSKDSFEEIEHLIKEIHDNSPLDPHIKLDFEDIFRKLETYTTDYRTTVAQLAEDLQDLDDTRNQWLESTYVLDGARSGNNFAALQTIINQHEEYIEQAKKDFLESLSSIRNILRL